MAPLKSFLFASSGVAFAFTCAEEYCEAEDQTALLQSQLSRQSEVSLAQTGSELALAQSGAAFFPKLGTLNDPHTRKSALMEIEKTAVNLASMDRTQVTPIVVEVCTQTADLLNSTILGAILEEDALDRASLDSSYAEFATLEAQRAGFEAAIEAAEALVASTSYSLTMCREEQGRCCISDEECRESTSDQCVHRDRCELELEEIDEEIHSWWCVNHGGDVEMRKTTTFRTTTVDPFQRYIDKWAECQQYIDGCELEERECDEITSFCIANSTSCNTKAYDLQQATCEFHHVASGDLALYQQGFIAALEHYNDIVARVMIEEADRKVEWDVITRIICLLLTLTGAEDGDASSAITEGRIQNCWDTEVDVSHLDIIYRPAPPMLSLPELPPMPCTAEYDNNLVEGGGGLPGVCDTFVAMHDLEASTECVCLADLVQPQELSLGHYLLIDPALQVGSAMELTLNGNLWNLVLPLTEDEIEAGATTATTYSGAISAIHTQAMPDLTAAYRTDAEVTDGSVIAAMAWAYPSQAAELATINPMGMNIQERFAHNGGLLLLDSTNQVIEIRELASASGPLGQRPTAVLSFGSAQEITDEQAAAACPGMQPVNDYWQIARGAEEYCWVVQNEHVPMCTNGCFLYKTVTGKMAFPVIEGLYVVAQDQVD